MSDVNLDIDLLDSDDTTRPFLDDTLDDHYLHYSNFANIFSLVTGGKYIFMTLDQSSQK